MLETQIILVIRLNKSVLEKTINTRMNLAFIYSFKVYFVINLICSLIIITISLYRAAFNATVDLKFYLDGTTNEKPIP